jgi:predicted Zn-dependent peptidase
MFEGHPLGQRIIGPRANVDRFDEDDVRRHFARFYGAKNAIVCVAGPVEHKATVASARKHLAAWPSGAPAEAEPAPVFDGGPRWKHVPDSGSQTNLALILRGIPELDPAYMSFVALLRCLDDGMSTRLHYQLCDQKGLAYSINAGIEPLADVALLEVTGATANAKLPPLVGDLLALLGRLRDGVTEADLAKARTRYRHEMLASLDDPSAMAGWFGGAALYYPPPTLAERLAQMEAVTVADVAAAARRVIQADNLVLAVVGALSRARQGELRQVIRDWR